MAERTGFEPVEERLVPHRFSKPAHSTTLPSLQFEMLFVSGLSNLVNLKKCYFFIIFRRDSKFFSAKSSPRFAATSSHLNASSTFFEIPFPRKYMIPRYLADSASPRLAHFSKDLNASSIDFDLELPQYTFLASSRIWSTGGKIAGLL